MRFIGIGLYNTSNDMIQYPTEEFMEKFKHLYPSCDFHFIDPFYEKNQDNILNKLLKNNNNVYKYPTTIETFIKKNQILNGDIIVDFSGSWCYSTLKDKIFNDSIQNNYLLLPMSCGCNKDIYTIKKKENKYIDYEAILLPLIIDVDNYRQYYPPILSDIFKYENDITLLDKKILEYIVNFNLYINYAKTNKNLVVSYIETQNVSEIYTELSNLVNNIRWFVLGNTEIKLHYNKFININNYMRWYQYVIDIFTKIIPDIIISYPLLMQIVNIFPNKSYNFKLIYNDFEGFWNNTNDPKYNSHLLYDNYIQYEIFKLEMLLIQLNKYIKI